jgi:hypothetical protein
MQINYPLFFKSEDTLTAVISPVYAYQYRDTNRQTGKAKGFEFYNFTSRKMVRKLESSTGDITAEQFTVELINAVQNKMSVCVSGVMENMSASDAYAFTSIIKKSLGQFYIKL